MMAVEVAAGAGQAVLAGVFCVSAMGKVVGCQRIGGAMCSKAALDLGLLALAALAWWQPAALAAGAGALAVGAGGWLRERLRGNTICNCFGVLTPALHRWRNHVRGALALGGVLLLAAQWDGHSATRAAPAYLAALAAGGLAVLAAYAYAHASAVPKVKAARTPEQNLQRGAAQLRLQDQLGLRPDGSSVQLRHLLQPGRPLALLFTMAGCEQCEVVKKELAPVLGRLDFPLHIVLSGPAPDGLPGLRDPDNVLRQHFDLEGVPSLVIIDPETLALAQPAAFGNGAIYRDLLRLGATGAASPGQADPPELVSTVGQA
ncbi:hypothetical protein [Pseudoduganella sp.]|uniref:hypothetical protein n=1 Tax=Pseudoduganella sp. TaxID=1880898 RepID=UPI0035B42697